MKGKILDFSISDSRGVISGDDGNRYTFVGMEWKSSTPPQAGICVDYVAEDCTALAVYLDSHTLSNVDNSPYGGFYRSSDDEMLGGVCAGLAHKWNFNRAGLRFATFIGTILFSLIPLLIYISCWIVLPSRPTKINRNNSIEINQPNRGCADRGCGCLVAIFLVILIFVIISAIAYYSKRTI